VKKKIDVRFIGLGHNSQNSMRVKKVEAGCATTVMTVAWLKREEVEVFLIAEQCLRHDG
jgi:hypothetical protein